MAEQEQSGEKIKRVKHSKEFKLDAVKLVVEGGRSVNEVARSLGIHEETLRQWKNKYRKEQGNAARAFPGKGHQSPEAEELRKVQRALEQTKQERDILKKALAYFAKEPQ